MVAEQAKLTRNQKLVLDRLEAAPGPLSAYALLDELREYGFRAPVQVYRALKALTDAGLAHRLESLNAFVACCHAHHRDSGTAAFTICDDCGQVSEFADEIVSFRLARRADEHGFSTASTTIEIRGRCKACANPAI